MYDEPTAGLDPVASTVVEDLIRSLQSQRDAGHMAEGISSYIVVTHQHSTIRRAVDRLVFLHEVDHVCSKCQSHVQAAQLFKLCAIVRAVIPAVALMYLLTFAAW